MGILPKCFGFSDSEHTSSSPNVNQFKTQIEELCHRFSLSQLRKSTNNFDKSQIIGRRHFNPVYAGCLHAATGTSDHTIAIKRMETTSSQRIPNKSDLDKEFMNEIELLCQIHHPNVISLLGFCDEKEEKILVYEYMPNGSLFDQLRREGTVGFIAPECWENIFTVKSDVYSFGMILLQVVSGKTLDVIIGMVDESESYSKSLTSEVFDTVERGKGSEIIDPFLKGKIATECWNMFMAIEDRCTVPDAADQRPSMGEVELELERVLELQEEVDASASADYMIF